MMQTTNEYWVINLAISLISQFFIYGVDKVLTKIRNADRLQKILSNSILEMSKIYKQYSEIANNLEEMFDKCPLPSSVIGELLVDTNLNNLIAAFRQTDFYSKYCDPNYLTEEKILDLLAKFLEIFEKNVMSDPELRHELYFTKLLRGMEELSTAVQRPHIFIQINHITIVTPALKEERLNNITTKLKLAGEYNSQGKYKLAEEEYKNFLALSYANEHPDYWKALNNMASILAGMKRTEEALPYLEKAYEIKPDNLDVVTNLGIAYLESRMFTQADDKLKTAIQKFPQEAHSAYNSYGVLLAEQGNRKDAIIEIDKAINIKPDESKYLMNKGMLLSDLGQHELAIEEYKKAIAIVSSNPEYYIQMGSAYLLKKHQIGALDPGKIRLVSFAMLRELGKPLPVEASQDVDEAHNCFVKAVDLGASTTDIELAMNMSMSYAAKGDYKKAEDLLQSICTEGIEDPIQIAVRLNLMHIYAWTDNYQKAENVFNQLKGILKDEALLKLYRTMGGIYLFNKQYENAITLFEEVIPHERDVQILTNLGKKGVRSGHWTMLQKKQMALPC